MISFPKNLLLFFNSHVSIVNSKVMFRAIFYHLHSLKNVKNTHGGVLLLVKIKIFACNFTKGNTTSWVFFTFFKLYKWYQIIQNITQEWLRRKKCVIYRLDIIFSITHVVQLIVSKINLFCQRDIRRYP